jgi:8-oxo-dGTP pyrophosphatase MutT (NUDIX family)
VFFSKFIIFFQILLVQQETNGKWGFPKGTPFQNEDATACAAREVMEEVGLDIRPEISLDDSVEITVCLLKVCFSIENFDLNFSLQF